jgi:hypothetical protein
MRGWRCKSLGWIPRSARGNWPIDLGTKVRVLAIAVEGLGRKQDRAQDGLAISAMLVQLGDEIADVTEMVVPSISATENWDN